MQIYSIFIDHYQDQLMIFYPGVINLCPVQVLELLEVEWVQMLDLIKVIRVSFNSLYSFVQCRGDKVFVVLLNEGFYLSLISSHCM